MKLKFLFAIALVITICFNAYPQNGTGKISGVVRDDQGKTLAGATIALQTDTVTTSKTIKIADKNGAFAFKNLVKGTYMITCTNVGFKAYSTGRLRIDETRQLIVLPVIVLQAANKQTLKEVVVTAKKPLIEQKIDRTIVNVDAMLTAAGSNALEVLSKSPGVIIGPNDDISLNGKNNVLILIDDKPTYMSAQDLAAYLRTLPGGVLDKLELMSSPPARYDASGGAIINIVLKKNKLSGFNGGISLGYNQGVYARTNNALNINYRTPKFNIFSNLSYSHDQNFSNETYNRYFFNNDGSSNSSIVQNSRYTYLSNAWNGRIGFDYFVSPKTTVGIMFTGSTRPKTDLLTYQSNQYNGSMQLDSVGRGYTDGNYQSKNFGINLNLQHKFDSAGRVLTIDLDHINFNSGSSQFSPADVYLPDGSLINDQQRLFTFPSNVNIYAGKIDYTHPLVGKAEFDAGFKSSYVSTDNHSNWFNRQGNNLVPDYGQTNHFRYDENINSAYVNLKKEWKRWGAQGGMRLENTLSKGHQLSNPAIADSSFTKRYTSLFPSLYLSYKLDTIGNNTLVLSYSKRIHRPGYQQLNPFLFFHDQHSYSSGNPDLVPNFNEFFELRYAYKRYFGITVGYWSGNNGLNPVTQAIGDIFITKPYNFVNNRTYSFIPYFSLNPTQWWTLHLNAVLLYIINKGNAGGITINQKANVHEIETSNEFRLSKTWSAELDGFFPGKQAFAQSTGGSVYNVSAGVQKSILQGLGTISLNANDIFNTLVNHNQTTDINRVSAFSTMETDTRRVGLSFTYRFGKAANARKRNNTGSAEDEKGRTN
ncbi:MAG: TonB-dependent receptor plug [Mucilaginibacter sp.]|nr:TonB-dependent receptor plug [Mucilaginibacter sp.]